MALINYLKKAVYMFTIFFLKIMLIFFIILLFCFIPSFSEGKYKKDEIIPFLFCMILTCCIYIVLKKIRKRFLYRFPSKETVEDIQDDSEIMALDIRCESCGSEYVEPFYQRDLCYDCRTELSKIKIDGAVKMFLGVILIISALSYDNILERVNDKILYERGKRYLEEKNYSESKKYLSKIAEKFSNDSSVQGMLFIVQVYTNRYAEAKSTYKTIDGKQINDKELVTEIRAAAEFLVKESR